MKADVASNNRIEWYNIKMFVQNDAIVVVSNLWVTIVSVFLGHGRTAIGYYHSAWLKDTKLVESCA